MSEAGARRNDHGRRTVVPAACAVFAATALFRYLALSGFPNDQYEHLAGAQQILMGEWPTKDFLDPGMPLTYLMSAASQLLLGRTLLAEAVLNSVAFGLAAAFTLIGAYRVSGSLAAALAAAALCVAIFPRPYAYPKVLLCAAGPLVMWAWMDRPTLGRLASLAGFVVVAFLFRHDYGVYLGLAALTTIVFAPSDGWRQTGARAGAFIGLAAALALPYFVYLQVYEGVASYVAGVLEYGRRHGQRTQLNFDGLGWTHEVRLYYAFYVLPLAALAWHAADRLRRRPVDAAVLSVCVLALLVNVGFLRDPLSARLADAIVPVVLAAAWLAGRTWRVSSRAARIAGMAVMAVVAVFGVESVWAVGNMGEQIGRTELARGIGRLPQLLEGRTEELLARFSSEQVPDGRVLALFPFFAYLDRCTTPRHRLLVTAYAPELYVYGRRMFAGGQKVFMQGYYQSEADQRRIVDRMKAQDVAFVLTQSDTHSDWRTSFPLVGAFVEAHFRPMAEIPVSVDRSVGVLVNAGLMPVRTEKATGWPCFR